MRERGGREGVREGVREGGRKGGGGELEAIFSASGKIARL